ncbi:hypothetical protein ECC02_000753 [Trypanosoma cruzi]|uniref:Myosin motor domain-containing protein n=1 Tax=Trypanosoma cruzi TaxID=5693 RepID=A0A7J6YIQ6_TRYCR|nr:hypothetical protein ECC02_000753 [Trypanosoma cruzi]
MNALKAGDHVFFRHPEHSWLCGVVENIVKGGIVCVTKDSLRREATQNEVITIKNPEDVEPLYGESLNDTPDDLLDLTVLHETTLLRCLYMRYMNDVVYTNIGAIVVALNPFTFAIPWYKDSEMQKYLNAGRSLSVSGMPSNLLPHTWAQAHVTYYEMVDSQENQCIIVSGESGAGKTEATKIVLNYLGVVSSLNGSKLEQEAARGVGEKLVACSPILECFGNAKTVKNDNSSRFGKFMKVKFNAKHVVVGAENIKYLLEKSRVVSAAQGERVFHSFYLLARAQGSMARVLGLEHEKQYTSLSSGGTMNNSEYNSEKDFNDVCRAMSIVGMTDVELISVWRVTAAVMTLLNVRFLPEEDGCSIDPKTMKYTKKAVQLLDVCEDDLVHELLTSTRALPDNEFALKKNDVVAAVDIRDAMCKHLYDGVFGWIVDRCNDLCNVENDGNWIGLLDIFGFENFNKNSFEQLCINMTNEQLQYHYNLHIFKRDMDECRMEGVDVTDIKFTDNTGCLKLLTAQGGIFPLLDECCWFGGGTDLGFLEKVVHTHESNSFFKKERVSGETFCVRHYAADVTYNVFGWVEKNRDTLKDSIKSIVRASGDRVIASCLPAPIPLSERKKGGKAFTVGGFFCNQLRALMDLIGETNPHWIRCIKPHPDKNPRMFYGREVMGQLESSGVLATVKLRKAGYPVRIPRALFCRNYRMCTSVVTKDEKEFIQHVLQMAQIRMPSLAQIGKTKVFLKAEAFKLLEKLRDRHLLCTSLIIQRISRGYLTRRGVYDIFLLFHKVEIARKNLEKASKDMHLQEADLRHSYELEEDTSWKLIKELEAERRVYQETMETAERERRRKAIEDERRRVEEARRLEELRRRAAICIQRHVRGELVRIRLYRQLLEERRASLEYERELACGAERREARALDTQRITDEKSWTQWLSSMDYLRGMKRQEEQRLLEKILQKTRIQIRELVRKEDRMRLNIEVEQTDAFFELFSQHQYISSHYMKVAAERRRRMEKLQLKTPVVLRPQSAGMKARAERSAAADARINKAITDFALSRARSYEEKRESQSPGVAPDRFSSNASKESSIFSHVQKNWLRQQEWMRIGDVGQASENYSRLSVAPSAEDTQYSGPYRTIEASLHSFPPSNNENSHSTLPSMSGFDRRSKMDPSRSSYETEVRMNKKKIRVDWDSVFGSEQ